MERLCMRCGSPMILGCQLTTGLFSQQRDLTVSNGGMFSGVERPFYLAVCPECGMLEPYVEDAKAFLPPKPDLPPVKEEKPEPGPEKAKMEPWFRRKNDDPWE